MPEIVLYIRDVHGRLPAVCLHKALDVVEALRGNHEIHIEPVELLYRGYHGSSGGYDIARIYIIQAHLAGYGRLYLAPVEVYPRGFEGGLAGLHHPFVNLDFREEGVERLLVDVIVLGELSVALDVEGVYFQLGLRLPQIALRLHDRGRIGARVDFRENVALLHELPLLEIYFDNLSGNLRYNVDAVQRGNGSEGVYVLSDALAFRLDERCGGWRIRRLLFGFLLASERQRGKRRRNRCDL